MNPKVAITNWLSPAAGKVRPLHYWSAFLIAACHLGVTAEVSCHAATLHQEIIASNVVLTVTKVSHWFYQCDSKRFDRCPVPRKGNTVSSRR